MNYERIVSNANIDTTNKLDQTEVKEIIIKTLDVIIDTLLKHNGPYSTYAMIMARQQDGTTCPIFTKDGISIINSLEFMSPIQTYIKDQLVFIGKSVDRMAGDGTTTSILFVALFLKDILKRNVDISKFTTREFVCDFEKLVNKILFVCNDTYLITIDTLKEKFGYTDCEAIKLIALLQALSSSHGNQELSFMVSDLFGSVSKNACEHVTATISRYNTDTLYKIEVDDAQYSLTCTNITPFKNNTELHTEFKANCCDLIVSDVNVVNGSLLCDVIENYCKLREEEYIKKDKYIILIVPNIDQNYLQLLDKQFSKLLVYRYSDKILLQNNLSELKVLNAVANLPPLSYCLNEFRLDTHSLDKYVIKDVSVHHSKNTLKIYNIYKDIKDEFHPLYKKRQKEGYDSSIAYSSYNEMLNIVEALLEKLQDDFEFNRSQYDLCKTLKTKMILFKRPKLVLGGTFYTNLAERTVIEDVFSAVKASLKYGFVVGGSMLSLNFAIRKYLFHHDNQNEITYLERYFGSSFAIASYKILSNLGITDEMLEILETSLHTYINITDKTNTDKVCNFDEWVTNTNKIKYLSYPIIQPYSMYTELFKCLKDLCVKIITTSEVIMPGEVVLNTKNKEKL